MNNMNEGMKITLVSKTNGKTGRTVHKHIAKLSPDDRIVNLKKDPKDCAPVSDRAGNQYVYRLNRRGRLVDIYRQNTTERAVELFDQVQGRDEAAVIRIISNH